jgi:uncharacterized iron-regulated protein
MPIFASVLLLVIAAAVPASVLAQPAHGANAEAIAYEPPKALDLGDLMDLGDIVARLVDRRVVFLGEIHDRYDHHLNQLEIIRRLHGEEVPLVIAMEFFQQPFQRHLDEFVAGELSEREFLERTEYFSRWSFDYRHYRPILQFAREHGIPLLALNLPQEITRKVGREGIESLTAEEREWVPEEIDRSDEAYLARLKTVFEQHPDTATGAFDRFVDVQLLWDEGMAARAAQYLEQHPERQMVVLAGAGHIAYGSGIPQRLTRRLPVETAIVLHGGEQPPSPAVADFLLFSRQQTLPSHGRLGIIVGQPDDGMPVDDLAPDSAAGAAGMRKNDRIVALDGAPIESLVDLRLALLDRKPGEIVQVQVRRKGLLTSALRIEMEVVLQ